MTPKEKAEELVLKYLRLQEPNYNWFHKGLAKQCALIAVNEIINTHLLSEKDIFGIHPVDYWEEVKQEIKNI
jgi:nitrogenase molybdenum-iron protein alpha/beta subunit